MWEIHQRANAQNITQQKQSRKKAICIHLKKIYS